MPAKDVRAYVKRNKNDAADAEAICEAVRRPTMRFVRAKSVEQQGRLMQHRTRDLLMRQRTQAINARTAALRGRIHDCTPIVSRKVRFFSLAPRAPSIHDPGCVKTPRHAILAI